MLKFALPCSSDFLIVGPVSKLCAEEGLDSFDRCSETEGLHPKNLVGQILIDQAAAGEREVILSVQDLPAGQYFLRVQAESGLVVKKVVVAH